MTAARRGKTSGSAAQMIDVTGRLARLYQGAPQEFVAARNALVRALANAGQRDLAERLRAATRPSTPAWVVNQLYWRERQEYEALLAAGAAARDAQQARLHGSRGPALSRALAERDAIVARLMSHATRLAAAGGVALTADARARARTSLEAIALRAGDATLLHGHLSADVELPGLQALAGLVTRDDADVAPRATLSLVPDPQAPVDSSRARRELEQALEAARADVERLAADHTTAREQAEAAAGARDAARLSVEAAARGLAEARRRLEQAEGRANEAGRRAAAAAEDVASAEHRLRAAAGHVDALAAALSALDEPPRRSRT